MTRERISEEVAGSRAARRPDAALRLTPPLARALVIALELADHGMWVEGPDDEDDLSCEACGEEASPRGVFSNGLPHRPDCPAKGAVTRVWDALEAALGLTPG